MSTRVGGGAQATAQWEELQEAETAPGGLSRSAGAEPRVSHTRPAHDPSATLTGPAPPATHTEAPPTDELGAQHGVQEAHRPRPAGSGHHEVGPVWQLRDIIRLAPCDDVVARGGGAVRDLVTPMSGGGGCVCDDVVGDVTHHPARWRRQPRPLVIS